MWECFTSFLQLHLRWPPVKRSERLVKGGLIMDSFSLFRQGSSVLVWEPSYWWPGGKKKSAPLHFPGMPQWLRESCVKCVSTVLQSTRDSDAFLFHAFKICMCFMRGIFFRETTAAYDRILDWLWMQRQNCSRTYNLLLLYQSSGILTWLFAKLMIWEVKKRNLVLLYVSKLHEFHVLEKAISLRLVREKFK